MDDEDDDKKTKIFLELDICQDVNDKVDTRYASIGFKRFQILT